MDRASGRVAALYAVVVLAWGLNYVFVRAGLNQSPPLWLATERAGLGFVGCAVFLLLLRKPRTLSNRDLRDALLLGIPNTALFFGLWFVAAVAVPPGQTAVIIYTFPLWVALLSGPILSQRLVPVQWIAIVGGFSGVILVAQPWKEANGSISPLSAVVLLAAALSWAAATVWYKRRFANGQAAMEVNTFQLLGGTLGLLAASLVFEPGGPAPFTPELLGIVLWLGLIGTTVAYLIWFTLLSRYPAANLTAYTFLVPVVALGASTILTQESLGWVQLIGVGLILLSVYGVARQSRAGRTGRTPSNTVEPNAPPGEPKGQ